MIIYFAALATVFTATMVYQQWIAHRNVMDSLLHEKQINNLMDVIACERKSFADYRMTMEKELRRRDELDKIRERLEELDFSRWYS